MSAARAAILAAIGEALPRPVTPEAIAEAAAELLEMPDFIRPKLAIADPVEAFAARVVSTHVGASLDRIPSLSAVPSAVGRYLVEHGLPAIVGLQPDPALLAQSWNGIAVEVPIGPDQLAAVALARFGIAETGTLVFQSGADTAVLGLFFPIHHIAVVRADTILRHLEDYTPHAGATPRNLNLITGASGTTDIEGQLVRGAHGPRFLHIVLIEEFS